MSVWNVPCSSGIGDRLLDIWAVKCVSKLKNEQCSKIHVVTTKDNKIFYFNQDSYFDTVSIPGCEIIQDLKPVNYGTCLENSLPSLSFWGTTTPQKINSLNLGVSFEEICDCFKEIAKTTRISNLDCDWAKDYIAIHVRRGDKLKNELDIDIPAWEMTKSYADRLHNEIVKYVVQHYPFSKILITGDDYEYMESLSKCLKNDVVIQRGSAIEDLVLLSKCKLIIQATKYSNFSTAAALLGGKPLINFNDILQGPSIPWDWSSILEKVTIKKKFALVVARYKEDIEWLSYLARNPEWEVHIYNDGDDLDPFYSSYFTIHKGDAVPGEASKYLDFICYNYFSMKEKYERIVFMQADPFSHSPDIIGLLENSKQWSTPYQGLTYGAYKPPWGGETKRSVDTSKYIGNLRLWCEEMNTDLTSINWNQTWLTNWKSSLIKSNLDYKNLADVNMFCSHYGARSGSLNKWYSAMFAVTPEAIQKQSLEAWNKIRNDSKININYEIEDDTNVKIIYNSGKQFAILMEYMWCPLLSIN
jgi:hypothetical protein